MSSLLDSSFEYAMEMLTSHACPPADKRLLQILLFPVEFKASVGDFVWALNQLVYHLCSILYQRQALGFPDRPVFGGTVAKNEFRLHVAEWKRPNEQVPYIEVRHQRTYSLKNANEVYDCMVLIRRLVEVAIRALQTDYQQLPTIVALKHTLETHRWRCFPSPECNDELQGIEGWQSDAKSRGSQGSRRSSKSKHGGGGKRAKSATSGCKNAEGGVTDVNAERQLSNKRIKAWWKNCVIARGRSPWPSPDEPLHET